MKISPPETSEREKCQDLLGETEGRVAMQMPLSCLLQNRRVGTFRHLEH